VGSTRHEFYMHSIRAFCVHPKVKGWDSFLLALKIQ